MFSLSDIDGQIEIYRSAAIQLDERADHHASDDCLGWALRGAANGLRDAAGSLERMIQRSIEAEAREAMR